MAQKINRRSLAFSFGRATSRVMGCVLLCALLCALLMLSPLPIAADESDAESAPVRYGYTTASERVQYVYDLFVEHTMRPTPSESFELDPDLGVTVDEVRAGLTLFLSDYPECFWVQNAYRYSYRGDTVVCIYPSYSHTGVSLSVAKAELDAAVEAIMDDLPALDTWETALYLHDLIADRVEYLQVGEHQTAYGALVSGKAVCAGYAAAYHLLLREAGIRAWTVTGSSVDPATGVAIPHAWNVVWLDDDTCVWTDVTWDDQGDRIYHAYFQISLSEMSVDHNVDANIFTLPTCEHDQQSYFDIHNAILTDQSTPEEAAALFGAVTDGARSASFCYEGNDFDAWLSQNLIDLYRTLGGGVGSFYRSYSRMGNEIRLTLTGSFRTDFYQISLTVPSSVSVIGPTAQRVAAGDELDPVTLTAPDGYYFPTALGGSEQNGVRITRIDAKTLRISGRPTGDLSITLPTPSAQTVMQPPTAVFTATGADSGLLSGVSAGMEYSTDGITWYALDSDAPLTLTGLSPCTLRIVARGDGEAFLDSPIQQITLTKHTTPQLIARQPSEGNPFGAIPTNSSHEICLEGGVWIDCTGTCEGLEAGDYLVRVRAIGTVLASDAQRIEIVAPRSEDESDPSDSTAQSGEQSEERGTENESAESDRGTGEQKHNGGGGVGGSVGFDLGCASALPHSLFPILVLLGAAVTVTRKREQ